MRLQQREWHGHFRAQRTKSPKQPQQHVGRQFRAATLLLDRQHFRRRFGIRLCRCARNDRGDWASTPTYTQLMGPGVLKAGATVQSFFASISSELTTANTYNVEYCTGSVEWSGRHCRALHQDIACERVTGQAIIGNSSGTTAFMPISQRVGDRLDGGHDKPGGQYYGNASRYGYQTMRAHGDDVHALFRWRRGHDLSEFERPSTPLFNGTASTWIRSRKSRRNSNRRTITRR